MSAAPKLDAEAVGAIAAAARSYAAAQMLHQMAQQRADDAAAVLNRHAAAVCATAAEHGVLGVFAVPLPEIGRMVVVGDGLVDHDPTVNVWPMLHKPDEGDACASDAAAPLYGYAKKYTVKAGLHPGFLLYRGSDPAAGDAAPFSAGCCEWVPLSVERPPVGKEFVALVRADVLDMELAEVMPDGRIETMTGAPAVAWLRGLVIPEGKTL